MFLDDTANSTLKMAAVPVNFVVRILQWAKERGNNITTSFGKQYYSERAIIARIVNGIGEY